MSGQLYAQHPKWKETEYHSLSSCLHARITGLDGPPRLVCTGLGIQPRSCYSQPLNQPRCSPSPNLCVLYRVSLHNPGQPKTCYVDMMAGREHLIASALGYTHCLPVLHKPLCFFHIMQCGRFCLDCYYLYAVQRILWLIYLTLWQSITNWSNFPSYRNTFSKRNYFPKYFLENIESTKREKLRNFTSKLDQSNLIKLQILTKNECCTQLFNKLVEFC